MPKTIRLDFDDGDYVELRDPGELSYRKFRAVCRELGDMNKDEGTPAEREARVQQWLRDQVVSWRLVDRDSDKVMSDPQTDDIEGASPKVVKRVMEAFMEAVAATQPTFRGA